MASNNFNRCGDYSAAAVDAVNDADFWTLQEYSTSHVGSVTNGSGRWAAWWANVTVAVPANDNFSAAITIGGSQGTTNGTNIRATKELGEPNHAGKVGGASIWYNWTAPTNGDVTVDTIGSGFDTVLGVYTGSSVGSLTTIASDDDSGGNRASRVTFTASSGTTYHIAVDGYSGTIAAVVLNWLQPTKPFFVTQPDTTNVYQGDNVTFASSAIGAPNLAYQWQRNGADIFHVTTSNYTISNVQTNHAAGYRVIATNSAGYATSSVAVLTVLVNEATLSSAKATNSTFQFSVAQLSNRNYIVQANTNLSTSNWVSLTTNTAPFTITDPAFTNYLQRFYRALYKP